ncbi:hypothetical protein [Terrihabitans sp. B22-R8]|uniref:hypothetical protein n=1 Tax=Terrihabitans sp. B22-R8 TaxID=3425128 RepID=UPI00403D02F9
MVEPLLYAALGFLTASLLALFFGRALWNRAVRITTHRIMRRLPLSREEIVASRDLLRAEQAVEYRRLERQSNLMRERMGASMAAVGERDVRIAEMKTAIAADRAKLTDSQARETAAREEIDRLKAEHDVVREKLAEAERNFANTKRDMQRWQGDRGELMELADQRRAELAEASARFANLQRSSGDLERQLAQAQAEAARAQTDLANALAARQQEVERAERFNARLVETESRLSQALTQLETAGRDRTPAATRPAASPEDMALLRQQIEKLGRDLARVAGAKAEPAPEPAKPSGGGRTASRKRAAQPAGTSRN